MKSENLTRASGFVVAADEGQPFWFLNTLTITKVGSDQCGGQLSIVDHRVPPGFAPPPHIHHHSDEALLILDGQLDGFCGNHQWRAGPGSLVFMPRAIPHGFAVSDAARAGSSSWPPPAASTSSSPPPAAGPGPVPARTRPARPGPPHATGRRPRHPDPAPARTVTTPGTRLQPFGLRILEDHRRKDGKLEARPSRRTAETASNSPRRLPPETLICAPSGDGAQRPEAAQIGYARPKPRRQSRHVTRLPAILAELCRIVHR